MTNARATAHASAQHATRGAGPSARARRVAPSTRPPATAAEGLLRLQRTAGNAAVAQLLGRYAARQGGAAGGAGLRVGPPDDRFEREARTASAAVQAGRPVGAVSRLPAAAPPGPEDEVPAASRLPASTAGAEEDPQRHVAQPLCAGCEAAAAAAQRAPAAAAAGGLDTAAAARAMAEAGAGRPLEPGLRQAMERGFGRDLRAVRVHTGAAAARAAAALRARAFASGRDIYLGPGESPTDRALIAHELAHVVQQTAPLPVAAPRPVARLALAEAPAAAGAAAVQRVAVAGTAQREEGDLLDDITGAVGSALDTAGEAVGDVAEALSPEALLEQALGLLPAPVAALIREIRAQGILGYLGGLIRRGLGAVFGGLADLSPALAAAVSMVEDIGGRIGAVLGALAGGDCGPLFAAIGGLQSAIGEAAGAAWDRITEFLAPVGAFFRGIWDRFGAPAIDWLGQVAGEAWAAITGLGQLIWDATAPVRDTLGAAWDALKGLIGIGGDEGESGGGLIGWVTAQANRAWEGIKAEAAPVLEPIGRVVAKVQEILPLGAIMDLRGTVQAWLDQVSASATALSQPEAVGSEAGQGSLREVLLPALNNAIAGVRGGAQAAAGWVSGQVGGLADLVTGMLDGIGANPVLGAASGALAWLRGGVERLSGWARGGVGAVFGLVDQGLAALGGFARRALDFLLQLGATLGDLAGRLPDLVLGPVWRAIPACIRDPVVDFLVNQVLRRIPVFSQLLDVPDMWSRVVDLAMTLIRQVFVDGNLARAAWTFFSAMLNLIGLPPDLVVGIVARAASALGDILRDPVGFLVNLLRALKEGMSSFLGNALTHLLNGVSGWLFAQAQRAGLTPPASLSLGEVFRFVLDVLGLGVDFIFERLGKAIGPERAAALRRGMEAVGEALAWIRDVVAEGPAALWRHISNRLSDLWDTVLTSVVSWVSQTVVTQAITKLLTSLDPSGIGAVVNGAIAIYKAIESAVEYLRPMLEVVRSVLDGVGEIARGAIAGAAAYVEGSMARAVPIVVGFLANQVGLGDAGRRIGEMIEKLRERVAAVVDGLIQGAMGLLRGVQGLASRGVAAVVAWWRQRREFEVEGERHAVYLQGDEARADLMVASRPVTWDTWVGTLQNFPSATGVAAKATAVGAATQLRITMKTPAAAFPLHGGTMTKPQQVAQDLDALAGALGNLMRLSAPGTNLYPGSMLDPRARSVDDLWTDILPDGIAGATETPRDIEFRRVMARGVLLSRYPPHRRPNAQAIIDFNLGRRLRAFNLADNEGASASAHTRRTHVLDGSGNIKDMRDLALRALLNTPPVGPTWAAGAFGTNAAAEQAIRAGLANAEAAAGGWPQFRDRIIATTGNANATPGPVPAGAAGPILQNPAGTTIPVADLPAYLSTYTFNGIPLAPAVGTRPLYPGDPQRGLAGAPLTNPLAASGNMTLVLRTAPGQSQGWFVLTSYPVP